MRPFCARCSIMFHVFPAPPVSWAQNVPDNTAAASEERVKAASVYKFLSYVDWPAASFAKADSPYVVGVINADDVHDELTKITAGRTVSNRPVLIKKQQLGDVLTGVHVLFIGKTERARQTPLLKQLRGQPILLVTETNGALVHGSMINFEIADDRVRFSVSLDPVEKSGLKLNTRLLGVAIAVVKGSSQ